MKKFFLKSLALMMMLTMSVSMWGATQYCDALVEAADGDAAFSLTHVSGNTYQIKFVPSETMKLTGAQNVNLGVNQSAGAGISLGNATWSFADGVATCRFETASATSVPTGFYGNYLCFNKTGGKTGRDLVEFSGFNPTDIDWTTDCSSAGPADEEAPVMTSAVLESSTYNSAVIQVEASDNVGVTKYIVKNGDTKLFEGAAKEGKITVSGLATSTAYTLTVYAKDAAGNVSEGLVMTEFTTNALIYENFPTGHLADPNFGDINGRILLTVAKVNDHKIAVKAVHNGGSQAVKYMNVIVNGAGHEFGTADAAADDLEDFVFVDGIASLSSFTFNLNFFCNTPNWTTTEFTITEGQLATYVSGLTNPELTITAPATATIEKTVGDELTVAYTSLNTAAATITSNSACVTVEGNTLTAVKPGTAIITVAQAATAEYEAADATFTVNVSGTKEANTECAGWNDDMLVWSEGYTYAFATTATDVVLSITPDNNLPVGAVGQILFLRRDGGDGIENGICQIDGNTLTWTFSIDGILRRDGNPYLWNDNSIHFKPYMPSSIGVGSTSNVIIYHVGEDCANHPVESVAITTAPDELIVGQNATLVATLTPANATNKNLAWSIESGAEYASITSDGVLTANAPGEVVVKVTSEDGSKTDTKTIQINAATVDVKTYSAYHHNDVVYMLYSVTRNVDKTLTFANLVDATMDANKQVHIYNAGGEGHFDEWHNLTKNNETGKYEYTTTRTFEQGEELTVEFYCAYPGAACSKVFNYTVGAEQAEPASIEVDKIVISQETASMAVGEDLQLTATAYPAFATNPTLTWAVESGSSAGVSATGNVHANASGTTVIKVYNGEKKATCTVNVVASIEPTEYHGQAFITFTDKHMTAFEYTITRQADHHVLVSAIFEEDMTGRIEAGNYELWLNGTQKHMSYDAATKTASIDLGAQAEEAVLNIDFYLVLNGGGVLQKSVTYTVGTANEADVTMIALSEVDDNADKLAAKNNQVVNVAMGRAMTAGSLNTLCLPFSMDAAQIEAFFGTGTEINRLVSSELRGELLHIDFALVNEIVAGVPYLIIPGKNVAAGTVIEAVEIDNTLRPVEVGYIRMYGLFNAATMGGDATLFLNNQDNCLYPLSSAKLVKGMRAYFLLDEAAPAGIRARVRFGNAVSTDVETMVENEVNKVMVNGTIYIIREGRVYDMQGQLVK